ncbi:MAG: succinate dehydrogenase assembly factor 2 [Steroidobacteraceae bacterium]
MSSDFSSTNSTADGGIDPVVGRLRWRCRRGMKELDTLVLRWLDQRYATASPAERDVFARFLELQDPELLAYLVKGEQPTDPQIRALVAAVLELRV